jgi:hypothetical protein
MYKISLYTRKKAKKLNVIVLPSEKRNKKIDVYDIYGNLLASVGDPNYLDYPSYLRYCGKKIAEERRKAYKLRHENDRHIKGSAGYYADQLLW